MTVDELSSSTETDETYGASIPLAPAGRINLKDYRSDLAKAFAQTQNDYDKTVLWLSSGALGVSFAFVKEIVGSHPINVAYFLFWAWVSWGASVTSILASYYSGQVAHRLAIQQVDTGTIRQEVPGRRYTTITLVLNAVGGILFFTGVVLVVLFTAHNLS